MEKTISQKEFKEFIEIYHKKNFIKVTKYKTNKLSKFISFMMHFKGYFNEFKKDKEYTINEVFDLFFNDISIDLLNKCNYKEIEIFKFISDFNAIGNLKNLNYLQLKKYISFLLFSDVCKNKNEVINGLSCLYKIK